MSREKNLVKNTAIISLGTFFPRFITILITPILTAKLTHAEYGTYDLIITIVTLLLPAVTLQISSAAFRFLLDYRTNLRKTKEVTSTILIFIIVVTSITCLLFYCLSAKYIPDCRLIATAYLAFDILLIAFQQIERGCGKNFAYSISCIIRSVTDTLFVAILLGIFGGHNYGLNGALLAITLACSGSSIYLFFSGKIYQLFDIRSFSFKTLKELLQYSWPMVPNNLSGWVLRLSDRLVITTYLGIEANSVYAAANKMPTIFSSVQDTFSLAWQENASLATKDSDKDEYYTQMCDGVFSLLTGLMAGLIMCTPVIWNLLIRGDYAESYYQLPVLYLGMYFSCLSLTIGGIYIAHKKTRSVGITTVIAAVINLSIDLMFVKVIGIWAGSVSTLVSFLFLFLYRTIDIQKFQTIRFNKKKIGVSIILLVIMGIFNYLNTLFFNLANVLICFAVLFMFNRPHMQAVISYTKKLIQRRHAK